MNARGMAGDSEGFESTALMSAVTVTLPSLLDPATGGVREMAARGDTLREVFADLIAREPRLKPHLFDESGDLRQHVLCFHNGTNTRWLDG
jgi:hypothetical protein